MTPALSIGVKSGAPWFDMWDDKVLNRIEELAKEAIVPFRDDPRVIGYYSDNEIGWWNAILWKMALEQPPSSGQRQRLIRLAREIYKNDWQQLIEEFEPQNAASWQDLDRGGMLWLRPGGNGIRTVRRFVGLVAERYYQVMRDTIHKFDPNAMYLGDRYQSFYYPEVAAASRRYVDVVSTNLNASWNDGTFTRSYLDTLHALTDKPILVSEFYMAAAENGSGNKNCNSGFPTVRRSPNVQRRRRKNSRPGDCRMGGWFNTATDRRGAEKGRQLRGGWRCQHAEVTAAPLPTANLRKQIEDTSPAKCDCRRAPSTARTFERLSIMTALKNTGSAAVSYLNHSVSPGDLYAGAQRP